MKFKVIQQKRKGNQLLTLFLFLSLMCSSCANSLYRKSMRIEPGLDKREVLRIMGFPGNKQFRGNNEAWQWCKTDYWGVSGDMYILVWFYKGTVTGMNTYQNREYGSCASFYRTIDWEERPDDIIELRHR